MGSRPGICLICHAPFEAARRWQQFCGPICRGKFWDLSRARGSDIVRAEMEAKLPGHAAPGSGPSVTDPGSV